ncbi:MAG: AAA family ATPase [Bacteroidales bacterium]|nr:AAA family ATPase [Bacteroidales bacterium]
MLSRLNISNYVLIDSLDITFPEGLIIITGATGAGKSILLGALGLVLGSKSDVSVLGDPTANCVVEAEFSGPLPDDVVALLEENDVETDGGNLIIRRVVAPSGRSRSFINDSPVQLALLGEISSNLLDIHSQHQTLLLKDTKFQLSLLDAYAGNAGLLEECASAHRKVASLKAELSDLDSKIALIERDRDYNEALLGALKSASLRDGELEELEAEQEKLANAESIKTALCEILGTYEGPEELSSNIADSLKEIRRRMEKLVRYIPSMDSLSSRVDSARVELEDIISEVESENAALDVSPERLQEIEDRLSLIYSLLRKHNVGTVAELLSIQSSLEEVCLDSSALSEKRSELAEELERATRGLEAAASALRSARAGAVPAFSAALESSVRSLELPLARFTVELVPLDTISPSGFDAVRYLFSATGANPVEVARCASGGEMSRIMLCLKDMMARYSNMPTMIFDEIDTGVSGSVADRMGSMICSMGRYMQVFAITHLPQVAAKGDAHYLVSKTTDTATGTSVSTLSLLEGEARVLEIARMLSGSRLTDASIANARSLMNE